jgi:hypothetical protein
LGLQFLFLIWFGSPQLLLTDVGGCCYVRVPSAWCSSPTSYWVYFAVAVGFVPRWFWWRLVAPATVAFGADSSGGCWWDLKVVELPTWIRWLLSRWRWWGDEVV